MLRDIPKKKHFRPQVYGQRYCHHTRSRAGGTRRSLHGFKGHILGVDHHYPGGHTQFGLHPACQVGSCTWYGYLHGNSLLRLRYYHLYFTLNRQEGLQYRTSFVTNQFVEYVRAMLSLPLPQLPASRISGIVHEITRFFTNFLTPRSITVWLK